MNRIPIRDNRARTDIKPRILDFVINDDGTQELEVKDGRIKRKILLSDLQAQIREAQSKYMVATEPPIR